MENKQAVNISTKAQLMAHACLFLSIILSEYMLEKCMQLLEEMYYALALTPDSYHIPLMEAEWQFTLYTLP